ncbi:S-adenosyl-L-methionine-dependent methyltransferase [Choiromyces venosus 120613-1]|uniref:S-adenosyl-L-methionine-dependent methyltransferase n=1 Tax=Choiromyces venosus 120613-1 TaxID=1336337 RepID=A0A3N4J3C1_9PEZI|nr:S-adenosyl-L-methionine-dependent methyltransferase [Choiromyces venosus 120613-1]
MYSATELYPNAHVTEAVHEYCIEHSTPLPKAIHQHREKSIDFANKVGMDPDMMINTLQAQFMLFLAKLVGAKKVLEVGSFTGYSALAWAEAIKGQEGAKLVCIDIPGVHTDFAKATLSEAGFFNTLVTFVEGDSVESLQSLPVDKFDIIFLDANKDGYLPAIKLILSRNLLSARGIVIADNALKRGLVAEDTDKNPNSANLDTTSIMSYKHVDAFNKFVRDHEELEQVMLPAFDGLNIIRLKQN